MSASVSPVHEVESPRESHRIGVLLMAYGGPSSVDDLPGYLADIRSGRTTSRAVLDEMTHNYMAIGGASPLGVHTARQAEAIGTALHDIPATPGYSVYTGMRHWSPWIEETVGQMISDGITRAVSLVLAPHYSALSVAKYQARIAEGLAAYRGTLNFAHVDSYYEASGLINALAARVTDGLARWPEAERSDVHVVFSAHSLPVRIIAAGDPYDTQVKTTARLVAQRVGLHATQWSWSYQSAGRSPEPWLGPTLPDHLRALAKSGVKNVVSIPVGFVCDHVEVLYDIDIDAQQIASSLDMRLERPPALNDDPRFINEVARVIHTRAQRAGWV